MSCLNVKYKWIVFNKYKITHEVHDNLYTIVVISLCLKIKMTTDEKNLLVHGLCLKKILTVFQSTLTVRMSSNLNITFPGQYYFSVKIIKFN